MIQHIIAYVNFNYPHYNDENYDKCFIKSCLVYKYLYDKYFNKILDFELIKYQLNNGLIDILFQTKSNVLKNHLIFSYAFSEFYKRYKLGRGCVYLFSTSIKSSTLGFLTGTMYWFFHKGVC